MSARLQRTGLQGNPKGRDVSNRPFVAPRTVQTELPFTPVETETKKKKKSSSRKTKPSTSESMDADEDLEILEFPEDVTGNSLTESQHAMFRSEESDSASVSEGSSADEEMHEEDPEGDFRAHCRDVIDNQGLEMAKAWFALEVMRVKKPKKKHPKDEVKKESK